MRFGINRNTCPGQCFADYMKINLLVNW